MRGGARHFRWLIVTMLAGGCVDHLPEQDLRILTTTPAAKMSVALLWKEFAGNATDAGGKYKGQAVEITGDAENFAQTAGPRGPDSTVQFPQGAAGSVTAHLLGDGASQVQTGLETAKRITLRCFVEGLEPGAKVLTLRSCVKP